MRKIIVVLLFSPLCILAQVNSASPFTLFGVGDLSEGYFLKNISMGGASTALRDPLFLNFANPSSLSSLELTALDFGVTHRLLTQTDQNSGAQIKNSSSYFHYFSLGFKLQEWWGMGFALTPYSQIGYDIYIDEYNPDFGDTRFTFQGDGGINQIVFGNGFEVYKNLSLGANVRYLFGTNRKRSSAEFTDPTFFNSRRNEETRISDVVFDFGLQYEILLNKDEDDFALNNFIIGATYGNDNQISAKRSLINYTYVTNAGVETPLDTITQINNLQGSILLPGKYSVGLSYGGLSKARFGNSWTVTADYTQVAWSAYEGYEGEQGLKDSRRISVGGHFTPLYAFGGGSKTNYFNEIEWRLGGFYEDSHILVDDQAVVVKGLSAGFNLPFKPRNLIPGEQKLNNFSFGIVYGTKSSDAKSLIQEDFINLTFGITFNDLWFQKRKYR